MAAKKASQSFGRLCTCGSRWRTSASTPSMSNTASGLRAPSDPGSSFESDTGSTLVPPHSGWSHSGWQSTGGNLTGGNLTGGDTLVDRPTGSRSCLNCRRARLAGADVAAQALPFAYQLVHAVLDDVADAHDADQPTALDHRHVSDPVLGHQPHQALDRVPGGGHRDVHRHDRRDRRLERTGTVRRQYPDDVALGDDPIHPTAVTGDHQRADVVLGERAEDLRDRGDRRHGDDEIALAAQHVADEHSTFSSAAA